jgi:SWI/SNF-related matrix-associated actin-dependent regulator of chromatin subfamily D
LILHIDHFPERFKVLEPLAALVGMKEGTRSEVMAAIWKLVKFTGAQDKDDGSIIRPSGGLEKVSRTCSVMTLGA